MPLLELSLHRIGGPESEVIFGVRFHLETQIRFI